MTYPIFSTTRQGRILPALLAISSTLLVGVLTGCGTGAAGSASASGRATSLSVVKGVVQGGQQPVSGATIQLYAVNMAAAKGASTALIPGAPILTDGGGGFNITGLYPCPAGSYVYLLATGGNPGLSGNVNNAGLQLMTALGSCSKVLSNYPFLQVNELTTVSSVYSLAGFMADSTHIGASSNNVTGISNAFDTVVNLVSPASGIAPGVALPSTSTVPVAELDTLADIIALCINSDGTGTPCASLYAAATPSGASAPSNTVSALLNIARNPASNVAALYNLTSTSAPFQPTLTSAPKDWTVAITASGGGLNAPAALAIDAVGSVWAANSGGNTVTKLSDAQVQASGPTGFTAGGVLGTQGIAIDTNGNTWIANSYGNSVVEVDSTGFVLSPSGGYTTGALNGPTAIAIDTANNIWVANFDGSSVTGYSVSGNVATLISGSPFTASGAIQIPNGIAIDASSNVWITSSGGGSVVELSNTGANLSGATGFSDGLLQEPFGVAIDSSSRVYVAGNGINDISIFAAGGTASTPIRGSSLNLPSGVAIDGANVVFSTNGAISGGLTMLTSPAATAIGLGSLNSPLGVAVDASGNVWTANSGDNTVSEFVGLATPVRTPLVSRFGAF